MKFILVVSLCASGCVSEVRAGGTSTGAPLRIETRLHSESFGTREQVGTVQYTNSAGQNAGTAAIYENRTVTVTKMLWRPFQGDEPIADEDFFRFVGDTPAAESSHAYRRRGRWMVRIGVGASVLGAAGMIFFGAIDKNLNLFLVGCGGLMLGPSIAYFGFAYQHPDNHAMSLSRAQEVLQRYTEQHPATTGTAIAVPIASAIW